MTTLGRRQRYFTGGHYQSLVVEYDVRRYLELTENQATVPHHSRISTLVKHGVQQRPQDSSLDLEGNNFMKFSFLTLKITFIFHSRLSWSDLTM